MSYFVVNKSLNLTFSISIREEKVKNWNNCGKLTYDERARRQCTIIKLDAMFIQISHYTYQCFQ